LKNIWICCNCYAEYKHYLNKCHCCRKKDTLMERSVAYDYIESIDYSFFKNELIESKQTL